MALVSNTVISPDLVQERYPIPQMRPEIARRWVAKLRSGVQQTTGCLRREDEEGTPGFCCLGVLCEVAVEDGVIPPAVQPDAFTSMNVKSYRDGNSDNSDLTYAYMPPPTVLRWAFGDQPLDNPTPGQGLGPADFAWSVDVPEGYLPDEYQPSAGRSGLTGLNDGIGATFEQIADLIERQHLAGEQ